MSNQSIIPLTHGLWKPNGFAPMNITVDTTNTGSASTHFILPLHISGTYNFIIEWGDSSSDTITTYNDAALDHTYSTGGVKNISISGICSHIYFNNTGDKLKLTNISQWGDVKIGSLLSSYRGTTNLVTTYVDIPQFDASTGKSAFSCWRDSSFNGKVSDWVFTTFTSTANMFQSNSTFNKAPITSTSNVTEMQSMYDLASSMDQDLGGVDYTAVTNLGSYLDICGISTANYDLLLIALNTQSIGSGITLGAATETYTGGSVDSGTTDGTTANKLVDSGQNFDTTVTVADAVHNTTDTTYASVTVIDSDTLLTLDADIMVSGENYSIEASAAAKAKASLIVNKSMTITDGGPV